MTKRPSRPALTVVGAVEFPATPRDIRDVEDAVGDLKDAFLECRDYGHTWKVASIVRFKGNYDRHTYCPRCKTNRTQIINAYGEILSNTYTYPEDYQLKGMGRLMSEGRMALRREAITRTVAKGQVHDGYADEDEDEQPTPAPAAKPASKGKKAAEPAFKAAVAS